MSVKAAGAYLWELRDRRGLSRDDIAAQIRVRTGEGTNSVQVMRIEKGQPTNPAVFAAFVQAVGGSWDEVRSLLLDQDATEELGRKAAREWLKKAPFDLSQYEIQRQQAVDLIESLVGDPIRLRELIGYGKRLMEEADHETQ
jgi:transcriptional regulator with XRE-family HTH domain